MLSRKFAYVEQGRCVACGACMKACPKTAITVWKGCFAVVDPERCVGCGKCGKVCPAGCVEGRVREEAV